MAASMLMKQDFGGPATCGRASHHHVQLGPACAPKWFRLALSLLVSAASLEPGWLDQWDRAPGADW